MKINQFFLAAAAAMTLFASCSKENEGGVKGDAAVLKVQLVYGDAATYAVDTPIAGGANTTLGSALMYQMVGTNVFSCTEMTSTQITSMTSAAGLQIENVNSTVDGILLVGNAPTANLAALKALLTRAAIEAYAVSVESQQTAAGNAHVANVTIMGYGAASAAGTATDGHNLKAATVQVKPLVARIQVSGKVVNSAETDNQIQSITWKNVYFNRFYTDNAKGTLQNYTPASWPTPYASWATDAYVATTEARTNCYAYQFFPATAADADTLPMIIMKADVTLKNGTVLNDYYITIKSYKTGTSALTQMVANKIYNVDLSQLTVDHTDFTPDPNPEQVDLQIKVTIEDWTVETIIPEI